MHLKVEPPSMAKNSLRLITKEVKVRENKKILAQLIRLGEQEGMLSPNLAALLSISHAWMRKIIRGHAIRAIDIRSLEEHSQLVDVALHSKARKLLFLPKESIRLIVHVLGIPEAWTVYIQLWNDAEELVRIRSEYEALKTDYAAQVASSDSEELLRIQPKYEALKVINASLKTKYEAMLKENEALKSAAQKSRFFSEKCEATSMIFTGNPSIFFINQKPLGLVDETSE